MVVNEQLKRQIIIEILALLFLFGVICYAVFAFRKSNQNKVSSYQGMVIVIDDEHMKTFGKYSDGEGLEIEGAKFTVTNNNNYDISYDLVVTPTIHDEEVLKQVRISVDNLYVATLTELPRKEGGYVIKSAELKSGYTQVHLIKAWFKLDTSDDINLDKLELKYNISTKK